LFHSGRDRHRNRSTRQEGTHRTITLRQIHGETERATAAFERAIELDADFFLAHHNLGKLLASQQQLAPAIAAFGEALHCKPDAGEVHLDLGNVYRQLDAFEQAVASYKAAARCMPKSALAWNNLGAMLQQRGEVKYSLACQRRALKLDPDLAVAHFNLAMLLEGAHDLQEAQTHYERALALQPESLNVLYHLTYLRMKLVDWDDHEPRKAALVAATQAHLQQERTVSLPLFSALSFDLPQDLLSAVTRQVARAHARAAEALQGDLPAIAPDPAPQRLRIGYVSPDFRFHAMGTLISTIFAHHQRPEFEIFAYSLAPIVDDWTRTIQKGCDHYIGVSELSPLDIARRIRADGIHILIDLAGYTSNARTTLFALQAAPVQALYLGYPGSMGADFIGHVLADRTLIPPESADRYTEQVVYLPLAWTAGPMEIAPTTLNRVDCGLPEQGMVYCCFNGIYKIDPGVFRVWMCILQRVPGSVLWLAEGAQPIVMQRLRAQAEALGVDAARLVFAGVLPHAEYLARYRLADLFLDTFAYNAGATAVGALWAGLPVLTCPGDSYAARMGASVCDAVGLPELICHSETDYEERAVALGSDPVRLLALKTKLAQARETAPLFQPGLFVRELEQAYLRMWMQACSRT
jgi:protein O-GlcNAc transferase